MPVKNDGTCFACGSKNEYGLRLKITTTANGVEFVFTPPERFQGWEGMVHGGIVATMLDELIAWACSSLGVNAVTGELTVRYRQPLLVGRPIRGVGRVVARKGRLLAGESRLLDETGRIIAEANGKMMEV
ncbi:MAG: PaaI family thioesterase [bacterium]